MYTMGSIVSCFRSNLLQSHSFFHSHLIHQEGIEINIPRKTSKIVYNTFLVFLVLMAIIVFYDENHSNDDIGWLSIIVYWMFRSSHDFIKNIKEGKKKSAMVELTFVVIGFVLLLWRGIVLIF